MRGLNFGDFRGLRRGDRDLLLRGDLALVEAMDRGLRRGPRRLPAAARAAAKDVARTSGIYNNRIRVPFQVKQKNLFLSKMTHGGF
jgi:hypothetical protein